MIFKPMENNQADLLASLAAHPEEALSLWDRFLTWLPAIAARNVLGGGLTLALLTLPVVIVSAQEAIRAVPPSIRHGAYALGATQWQVIWHHVLPLARPGILTGTILAVARAIGEAAPLILFGALLLVQQEPSLFSRFTIMPMQIFGWVDRPTPALPAPLEQQVASTMGLLAGATPATPLAACASAAYVPTQSIEIWRYNAAMASILLLIVLLGLNAVAIVLRNRAQRKMRW
jgi:ABC-type phosphate transport system permease subunit